MRPILNKEITIADFQNFYWLKEELQSFCRENNISAIGSKIELTSRIEHFLLTGEALVASRASRRMKKSEEPQELSLNTVITENHRCNQNVRAFFKTVIPKFHFSTHIQKFFKENVGKTYRDVVEEWNLEEKRKKDPSYKKEIAPQFEYNQFMRDFYSNPENKGKSRKDAIEAWNVLKKNSKQLV